MNTFKATTLLMFAVLSQVAMAATPQLVNYQGRLTDTGGNPVDSLISITFTIYDAPTGGNAVWQETHQEVDVQSGLFSVMLGSQVGLTDTVFADSSRWLAISLGSDPEGVERTRIAATPYAMRIGTIDGAKGGVIHSDLQVVGQTTSEAVKVTGSASSLGVVGLNWYGDGTVATNPVVTLSNDSAINQWAIQADAAGSLYLRPRYGSGTVRIYSQDHVANLIVQGLTTAGVLKCIGGSESWGTIGLNWYADGTGATNPVVTLTNDSASNNWAIQADSAGSLFIRTRNGDGTVRVYGSGGYKANLTVDGQTTTDILEITGGSDLAEPFDVSDDQELQAGSVVVIDENNPGRLTVSTTPYDRRVAGVISGAGGIKPGLTLKQEGLVEGAHNVALSGRVYVLASTENGPIQPGDRLTTSSSPGHCMKATDPALCDGAVLGKAMTPLAKGSGLVLALINLQ